MLVLILRVGDRLLLGIVVGRVDTAHEIAHDRDDTERKAEYEQRNERRLGKHLNYRSVDLPEWSSNRP